MSRPPLDKCKVPQALWLALEHSGLSSTAVLRMAGLPATLHLREQAIVTTDQFFALWRAIEALAPRPGLGVAMVEATETAVQPTSSLAAFHARDYRDGLARLARFKRLCTPEQLLLVESRGECAATIDWPYASVPAPSLVTETTFASLVELGRRGTGHRIVPRRMELRQPRTKGVDALRDYFGCALRYGAPRDALILQTTDLDRPFLGHNPELLAILTPALAAALEELHASSSINEQVKAVLKRNLASGRPELSDVARDLGMSERTLQRRITDQGASFRELLVEARQEMGRQLLSNPSADIDEVACLLGYQDTSSFYRAFRLWEGVTPMRWRELQQSGAVTPLEHSIH